jgi:uncharacterized protein (TIGR03083 family)
VNGRYPDAVGTAVIREHALGLAEVAGHVPLDTAVPSCPGWSMADLVWHLTEVELFWAHIIGQRPDGPDSFEGPTRPPDHELVVGLERAANALVEALTGIDPSEPAWSWSDDHTVGFTLRRQSHEAVVHHVDGCLAAGVDLPVIAPRLAADGVDEMIGVMLTGVPDWASFERRPGVIELGARDTGDTWTLTFGRMTGTSPESGTVYDLDALEPVDEPADATVEGDATDLHLWLWGRGDLARLDVDGDDRWADELRSIVAAL